MVTSRLLLLAVSGFLFFTPAMPTVAADQRSTDSASLPPDDGLLTLAVTVSMPDGSPAADAVVALISDSAGVPDVARADRSGQVEFSDLFGNGTQIHAQTADGALQATLVLPADSVRSAAAGPVELTLAPATRHEVIVSSQGRPVEDVHVAAVGVGFRVRGVTGPDGRAKLRLPAATLIQAVVAWHPGLGVAGVRDVYHGVSGSSTQLSLLTPSPHTIRVIDNHGNPVPRVELSASVRTEESDWILSDEFESAHVRTDDRGEAMLPWVPGENLKYIDVDIYGSEWKEDHRERSSEGVTVVHVRRKVPVEGHVTVPGGVSPEGLLVSGFGFGPTSTGDIPRARVRRDGSFIMNAASAHAYIIGVADRDWSSDLWAGVILGSETDQPAEINMDVYPATPLTTHVTRGSDHEPITNAWIHVSRDGEVGFVDESGEPHTGVAGVQGWLLTDAEGVARTGVGRGEVKLRLSAGDWSEEQTIEVSSEDPVELEFHRAWKGERHVTGAMSLEGAAYEPSERMVARAWTERSPQVDSIHTAVIRDDGTIEVAFDEENLALLVIDREKEFSGFARFGPEDISAELVMEPTATYSGTVLDENGEPLADRTLRLSTQSSFIDVVEPQQTDIGGRFQFEAVAVNTPLRLDITNEPGLPEYFLFGNERLFLPGEVRTNDDVSPRRMDSAQTTSQPARPLTERVKSVCCSAGAAGLHALVILQGGESENVTSATGRVLNYDEVEAVLGYLPMTVSAAQVEAEAAILAEREWSRPSEGEMVLIALNGDEAVIAATRISAADVNAAVTLGAEFLKDHVPPMRDALVMLAEAREQARRDDRRLWLIRSGPRCGPCFRLARWIEDHHDALEREFVILKMMETLNEHTGEIFDDIGGSTSGIPWHAMTEPDGTVLATSEGPLGNIGMPDSVEGIRHFRAMLEAAARHLSADEIDELVESLSQAR